MKNLTRLLIIVLFTMVYSDVFSQDEDPLADSRIIRSGGGDEVVSFIPYTRDIEIDIYKYLKEFELFPYEHMI